MSIPTPAQAFATAIAQWEGTWQDNPNDQGNYAHCAGGGTRLIGTMRGVTPDVYARFLGIDPCTLTPARMQQEITPDVAGQIAVVDYYQGCGLNRLTWSPLIAIAMDFGWTSGPARGVKTLQDLAGVTQDGIPGPATDAAVCALVAAQGIGAACDAYTALRSQFYLSISEPGTPDAAFRQGWLHRADWFLSTNPQPCWWDAWRTWAPAAAGV